MKYSNWYEELIRKAKNQLLNESDYTEKHHIMPKHMGGSDSPDNLVLLTYRQHILAHLLLWKIHGHREDETAYKLMKGVGVDEKKKMISSLGGKIKGPRNVNNGHMERIRHMVDWYENGKRTAEICRKKEVNAFFDPKLRLVSASLGGKVQGKINAKNGHLERISKLPRKRTMSDIIWITNNRENKWHDKKEEIPEGWRRGRTLSRNKKKKIQ